MEKKLVPYSVYLPEELFIKVKALAKERKASTMIRDAITVMVSGNDSFKGGYNKGIRDAISLIESDLIASRLSIDDTTVSIHLCNQLEAMIVNQNVKVKKNGKAKT